MAKDPWATWLARPLGSQLARLEVASRRGSSVFRATAALAGRRHGPGVPQTFRASSGLSPRETKDAVFRSSAAMIGATLGVSDDGDLF